MKPSIWTSMYIEKPLPQALEQLNACGWKNFEVSDEHLAQLDAGGGKLVEETLAIADRLSLTLPQSHAYLVANLAHPDQEIRSRDILILKKHLELSAKLGVKNVVVHPGRGKGYRNTPEFREIERLNLDGFRELADAAGELSLTICIENMPDCPGIPGKRVYGTETHELFAILDGVKSEALALTLDTSHANLQGLDIPEMIREWGSRLKATHISDNDGSGDQHKTPGGGKINWKEVMRAFADINYDGVFNLEIPGERHPCPEMLRRHAAYACEITEWLVSLA